MSPKRIALVALFVTILVAAGYLVSQRNRTFVATDDRGAAETAERNQAVESGTGKPSAAFSSLPNVVGPTSSISESPDGSSDPLTRTACQPPSATIEVRTPRVAAQLGLSWLECAALKWQAEHRCFGCHIQAQVLMGQAIARDQNYEVRVPVMSALSAFTRAQRAADGAWHDLPVFATPYAAMGLAFADEATNVADDQALHVGADWLVAQQNDDGGMEGSNYEPPVMQGRLLTTANALVALLKTHRDTNQAKYKISADRALAWVAAAPTETTQDAVYKVLALARSTTDSHHRLIRPIVEQLAIEQQRDGGWKETSETAGSNAYSTGQVLYAFKQAGVSIHSLTFTRGVRYLLDTQVHNTKTEKDGSWPQANTQSTRSSDLAATMWAVIGLAGSFGVGSIGGLEVNTDLQRDKRPSRTVEMVLDASGSMNLPMGASTRWQTAVNVFRQVVEKLPGDLDVGLRVYGHRYSSRATETCTDTELVVPIAALDRRALLATVAGLKPRGETPLVHALKQTPDDLEGRGRASVILITDGEESCGGKLTDVGTFLQSAGVDVTLHIVGFALKSKDTENEFAALARQTGGRFSSAATGDELTRAITIAAIQSLPYEIFDGSGRRVAARQTSPLAEELPPGDYRVVVHALDETLEQRVTVVAEKVTVVRVVLRGDRFALEL